VQFDWNHTAILYRIFDHPRSGVVHNFRRVYPSLCLSVCLSVRR